MCWTTEGLRRKGQECEEVVTCLKYALVGVEMEDLKFILHVLDEMTQLLAGVYEDCLFLLQYWTVEGWRKGLRVNGD